MTDRISSPAGGKPLSLSAEDARTIALRAQGLLAPSRPTRGVGDVLRRVGAVQLDTISVLARSHELVPYARLGATPRDTVEDAYWGQAEAFEYLAHAACILPAESWPLFAFRRRAQQQRHPDTSGRAFAEVRAHLRDSPITVSDLPEGSRSGAGWWNWSASKRAIEMLWRRGEAVVTARSGWRRVYDLPERALGQARAADGLADEECYAGLVRQSIAALGVGTRRDIANYFRLTTGYLGAAPNANRLLDEAIAQSGAVAATVEGWSEPAFADPMVIRAARGEAHRTTMLSPFDSLLWERERAERLFGFAFKLEAYTPKHQRQHGYFTMPVLSGGRLVGYVDPARDGTTFVARSAVSFVRDDESINAMAVALREAASWVQCGDVRVERSNTVAVKRAIERAVRNA